MVSVHTMQHWAVLTLLVITASFVAEASVHNRVVCYLGTWAIYRHGNGQYTLDHIDPNLCTHLIYSFVGITANGGINVLDTWNDLPDGKDGFRKFTGLKAKNPASKYLVAIGGWNEGSLSYSNVMANPSTRAAFINNAVNFVKQYNFDGFDLDWEYPAQRGGGPNDKENFSLLLKEMRATFDQEGLLLTAAVAAAPNSVDLSYDVPALNQYLHFINIMTYDLHGSWDPMTGQNAPLYGSAALDKTEHEKTLNVKACIAGWIARGASPSNLVLGIGTYGQTFTLATASKVLGAPASGPGNQGKYTSQAGMLGYNEICEMLMDGSWNVVWDDEQQVPYATKGNQWVSYDNIRSVTTKVEFAKAMGLGGAMIWSLETDDFRGLCGQGKYPLLSTINHVLNDGAPPPTQGATTAAPVTTNKPGVSSPAPTTTTRTESAPSTDLCFEESYVRDPVECNVFYYCQNVHGSYVAHRYTCGSGLVFDEEVSACNYRSLVNC